MYCKASTRNPVRLIIAKLTPIHLVQKSQKLHERRNAMANQNESAQELLFDIKVAEASRLYKLYLNQEKKILGSAGVITFLVVWELVGNTFQLINPMFMSAPSLVCNAAVQLFSSGEIYNVLYFRRF